MASSPGWRSRGYLPHFDSDQAQQAITWHLGDSLPLEVAARLAEGADDVEQRRRYEAYLDSGHGACVLRDPACAQVVQRALLHFDGERYRLFAWAVMPNHVHVLIAMLPGYDLAGVIHSWKRHTAQRINQLRGTSGPLWRREYWDRFIRDQRHFAAVVRYMEENPVKAGLAGEPEDWAWSSASERVASGNSPKTAG